MAFSEEDQADHYAQRLVDDNVAVIRKAAQDAVIETSSHCWNNKCQEPTTGGARWCNRECCAEWGRQTGRGDAGHGNQSPGRTW